MNRLEEITYEKFGDDAHRLLAAHAIVPLVDYKNPKAGIKHWNNGYDPTKDIKFHSLAVLTGPRSGITVWDIDSIDITPPVEPNVKTAKGCHIYTEHAGEARKIKVSDGLDVLGNNGYAIFFAADKTFLHARPADLEVMTNWMKNFSPIPLLHGNDEGYKKGTNKGFYEGYYNQMLGQGFELDVEAIERGYVGQMRSRVEGHRNVGLYNYGRELFRCGIGIGKLVDAATDAGLPLDEIHVTLSQAEADASMGLSASVHEKVRVWQDSTAHSIPTYAQPVVDYVARRAIELNDMSPFIVQQEIVDALKADEIIRTQQAISKTLVGLDQTYGVLKIIFLGYQEDGRRRPNAYRLCIEGTPVSELISKQPLAGANRPEELDSRQRKEEEKDNVGF